MLNVLFSRPFAPARHSASIHNLTAQHQHTSAAALPRSQDGGSQLAIFGLEPPYPQCACLFARQPLWALSIRSRTIGPDCGMRPTSGAFTSLPAPVADVRKAVIAQAGYTPLCMSADTKAFVGQLIRCMCCACPKYIVDTG